MKYIAGSFESSDCIMTVSSSETLEIEIDSIVFDQFGDQIKEVIINTLNQHNIKKIKVECKDKGALDFTVKARLETALKRGGYYE